MVAVDAAVAVEWVAGMQVDVAEAVLGTMSAE